MFDLSICLPCNGRPERTLRILEQIKKQNINKWELFAIGDCCSFFQTFIDNGYLEQYKLDIESKGNKFIYQNLDRNYGGYGYFIRNKVKNEATGKYLIYIDNDDYILENHFNNYLSEIKDTDLDMVYFDSYVEPLNEFRISELSIGKIGHSEIIVKTSFLQKMPDHIPDYEHDWVLINNIIKNNAKIKKTERSEVTYIVKSIYAIREKNID
jgi:hypothetical protein